MRHGFSLSERNLLNLLQADFPLVERPWAAIGNSLGLTEHRVMEMTTKLQNKNVVREISAVFDTRRLGYQSSLIAMRIPESLLDASSQLISTHPGVSHNYGRDDAFNLWFTLALPPHASMEQETARLAGLAQATGFRVLPTLRLFKIGVNFDMQNMVPNANSITTPITDVDTAARQLSEEDIAAVKALQQELPTSASEPFALLAPRAFTAKSLLAKAAKLTERGLMRRYGAVLRHRRAGFMANGMAVWNVPESSSEHIGQIMASFPQVTHCYKRPRYSDWPYSHFTMIHAVTRQECEAVATQISEVTGITDHKMLYSTREYKKTRVKYFIEDQFLPPNVSTTSTRPTLGVGNA